MPQQPAPDQIRPLTVAGLLRRRYLAILIPALLVPAAALALTLQQEKQYEATTSLLFRDSGLGSTVLASADPDREAATNLRLLQLDALERKSQRGPRASVPGRDRRGHRGGVQPGDDHRDRYGAQARRAHGGCVRSGVHRAPREDRPPARSSRSARRSTKQLSQIPLTTRPGAGEGRDNRSAGAAGRRRSRSRLKELTIAGVAPIGVRQVRRAEVPSSAVSPDPLPQHGDRCHPRPRARARVRDLARAAGPADEGCARSRGRVWTADPRPDSAEPQARQLEPGHRRSAVAGGGGLPHAARQSPALPGSRERAIGAGDVRQSRRGQDDRRLESGPRRSGGRSQGADGRGGHASSGSRSQPRGRPRDRD